MLYGGVMNSMNINEKILNLKADIIFIAQDLTTCNEKIDLHSLTELESNLEAFLKLIKDKKHLLK